MKSIFKKVALVMALAMVVTMLPARTVSAARADGSENQYVRKSCMLYLDGDATETYGAQAWATRKAKSDAWKTNGYTVTFTSEDESIATVGAKKGQITAVSVGKTNVVATFSKKGAADIVEVIPVTVKRNAAAIKLDDASQEAIKTLTVGSEVTLKGIPTDADGNEGEQYVSDYIKFKVENPEDKEVLTVDPKTGELKAVAAGKATVKVYTHQYEYSTETKGYKISYTATVTNPYEVEVTEKEIVAVQSAYNAFVLTFPNPEEAKAALTETNKSLTDANAAVSEADEIVKVHKVLADSQNAPRAVFISGVSYKDGGEGVTSSIEVTMFDELDEKSTYVISYKGQEMTITTPEYIADGLKIYGVSFETNEEYSIQNIMAELYTSGGVLLGRNWGDGDRYSCKKYQNWQNSLVVEDTNTSLVHNEYQFDAVGDGYTPKVWFYTTDRNFKVTLKATFEDWENINANGQAKVIPATAVISPNDSSIRINSFEACVVNWKTPWYWANWGNKTVASEDEGFYVLVKANITELGSTSDHYSDSYSAEDYFTFVSSNDDKLPVNKESGELYPPKNAKNGTVGIHIYYKNIYVGTLPVEIYAKRTFTSFSATGSLTKMSYSTTNPDVNESVILTLYPKDQLGANFNINDTKHGAMVYEVKVSESLKQYFENDGDASYRGNTWDGYPQYELKVKEGANLPKNIVNVRVNCMATYRPNDGGREVVRQYPVSFSLKDTSSSESTNYRLAFSTQSVDMKIETREENGVTINNINDKNVIIGAYGYDKDGYKVEKLDLDGAYNVTIKYGSKDVSDANRETSGKDVIFKPVITQDKHFATVSGSSIVLETTTKSAIEKLDEGSYVVALYKGTSNKSLHSMLIGLNDTQDRPSMTWRKDTSDKANEIDAIQDVVRVRYNNSDVDIYVGYEKDGKLTLSDDYTLTGPNGQNIYIAKVRYAVQFAGDWYEFEIPVKRTVVYGTNIN